MQMLSRFYVFMFLGVAFLFVSGTMDVHAQAQLNAIADTGANKFYAVGDLVEVTFWTTVDGAAMPGVKLIIRHSGFGNMHSSGITNRFGHLTVTGTLLVEKGSYISATWVETGREARVYFNGIPGGMSPTTIVVNPPDPKSPLKVGDTFTQMIEIQDVTDLASWQMDIAFNPDVLDVVDISEGDFLEQDGGDALFFDEHSSGKIAVKQVRVREPGVPMSGVSGSGVLVELKFRFVSGSEALLGLQNVRLSDASGERLSYSVTLTPVVVTDKAYAAEDVNQDNRVDILDLVVVVNSIGAARPNLRADVNDDGVIDVLDLVAIVGSSLWGSGYDVGFAPAARVLNLMPETVQEWIAHARLKNDGSLLFQQAIANLQSLLAASVPSETRLLSNYPNPFNPETWIPYHLSEPADVSVSIYSVNGKLVQTLVLGHQPAGVYQNKSRAAYWDGRNAFGERVASGLYFYTFTAGDFTATRKMLIRK